LYGSNTSAYSSTADSRPAGAQRVEVRVVAHLRLPVARQDHVAAGAELRSGQQDLGHLEQQQRDGLVTAALG
jgi:hypothetical protein